MKSPPRMKYNLFKYLSFVLTEMTIPLGTYIGFLLGTGDYFLAVVLVPVEMGLGFISWVLWARTLEMMVNKE